MAELRNTPENEQLRLLQDRQAKGEAFGFYFDEQGEIVHRIRTVGIQMEQLKTFRSSHSCRREQAKRKQCCRI